MINVVLVRNTARQLDIWIMDMCVIISGKLLTEGIVGIEIFQFHAQYGSVYLAQPAVHPHVFEHIFLCAAVIGESADHRSKSRVVGGHTPGIAQGTEIVARIE